MISRIFLFWIITVFSYLVVRAQGSYLHLDRPGFKNDLAYYNGDEITFRMKWEKSDRHDKILGFTDSTILFNSYEVDIHDLSYVKTENTSGFLSPSNGPKLIIAGLALPLVDMLNYSVVQGNEYRPDHGVFLVSGALVATGLFWTSLRFQKFRPGKSRKIMISEY